VDTKQQHFVIDEVPTYQQESGPRYQIRERVIIDAIRNVAGESCPSNLEVLDIGAGRGILSLKLARMGFNLTLLDKDKDALEEVAILFSNLGLVAEFEHRDIFEYYPKRRFDIVLMSEILEHINDVSALLYVRQNVINDGGCLIVTVPSSGEWKELPPNPIGHLRLYDKRLLRERLTSTGYFIEEMKYFGGVLLSLYSLRTKGISSGEISPRLFSIYEYFAPSITRIFLLDSLVFGKLQIFTNNGLIAVAKAYALSARELLAQTKP